MDLRSRILAVALLLLPAGAPASAQSILIDSFSTPQAPMALVFPPAGTTASSSAAGAGILGGERDIILNLTAGVVAGNDMSATVASDVFSYAQDPTIVGTGRVDWDGVDGAAALNPVGLGGVDLRSTGQLNAFMVRLVFADLAQDLVMDVHTDAANSSRFTLNLPGATFVNTDYVVPYAVFSTLLGAGADFADVGAISVTVGGPSAPDIVIDLVQAVSTLSAPKTVALAVDADGNGVASPGDTLEYTIIISNVDDAFDASETGVVFTNAAPANTTLVVGSVTTSQGTVTTGNTAGDTSVGVNVGTITDGGAATVTFRVQIVNPLPLGVTAINCQGFIDSASLIDFPTDDPGTPVPSDPTGIPVVAAASVTADKTAALAVDLNGDGQLGPGDTLEYTIVVTSTGNTTAAGVVFNNLAPLNTTLVVGSVTTTVGTVTLGNSPGNTSVQVSIGDMVPGATATITFRVQLAAVLPPGTTSINCQGNVTGTNFPPQVTNNPATANPNDPTSTPVVIGILVEPIPTLGEWGLLGLATLLGGMGVARLRRRRGD